MTALRRQAYDLLDAMPEGQLVLIVDILKAFQRNEIAPRGIKGNSRAVDFSKYMGRGKKMFSTTEDVDNYIRESRNDRGGGFGCKRER